MSSAAGSPADDNPLPDRPMIVAPTAAVPSDLVAMTGVVQSIQGDTIVVNGIDIVIGPTTRMAGDLKIGSPVRIIASVRRDGNLQARIVSVFDESQADATPTAAPQPSSTRRANASPTRGATPEPTERSTPRPTAVSTPEPTEKPEVGATSQPTPQPTEKPENKPTSPPSPEPTEKPETPSP